MFPFGIRGCLTGGFVVGVRGETVKTTARLVAFVSILSAALVGNPIGAGAHTWDVNEVFQSADGRIWFVELKETNGTPGETGTGGKIVSSLSSQFTITNSVLAPTSNKTLLFGNKAYAELAAAQGGTPADQVVNAQSFANLGGDTLRYSTFDVWNTGPIPSNGLLSRNRVGGDLPNSPSNYAGFSVGVDAASPSPSVVPDRPIALGGGVFSSPVLVTKIDADGNDLRVTWDVNVCEINWNHQLIYGELSDLPSTIGGTFAVAGSMCGLGETDVLDWVGTPNATDGSGLIWWIIVTHNGASVEGSWGTSDGVNERRGPGTNGSSGECGVVTKDVRNTCGG